jgi:intracellular septation protein
MKILFEFLPVILFFVAYQYGGIYIATAVAIGTSAVQIMAYLLLRRKIEPMMWVSLVVIVVFGGATLLLQQEIFIKWKPTILYWIFGLVLLGGKLLYKKNLLSLLMGKKVDLPEKAWENMNLSWAIFFLIVGVINLVVAYNAPTGVWVKFKLFGVFGLLFAFALVQSLFLSRYVEKKE